MDDNLNNTQSSREKPVYDPFARWLSRDHLDAPGITETPQLDLDQRSLEHLCNWAEQLCNNSGLKPLWIGLLQAVIPDIGALVTCDTLDALTKTRHALHEASELAEVSSQKSDATVEPLESTARRLIAESQHTSLPKLTRFNLCFHFTPLATPAASRSIILQPGLQSGVILGHETKAPPTSNDWDDIGGTFLVSGSARERDRVQSILSLLAFGTFHSILENRFYHDLGLDRRQPKPEPELPPDPPEKDTHIEVPPPIEDPTPVLAHEEIYLPASQPSSGRRWPNALWNFISGKTTSPGSSRPASPTPGPSSLSASSPKNPGNKPLSLPMKLKPRLKRKSRPQPASMGSNATIRSRVPQLDAWEILAPGPDTLQSYSNPDIEISPIPSPSLSTTELVEEPVEEPQPASANRFTQLADRINKTILSVSPDVSTFPPPQILLHLRDEEDAKGQHQKISVDARAGLASLVPNNTSLDGAIYHQSILFLRERCNLFAKPSEPPCDKLTWSSIRYYDFASDEKDNSFNDDILSTGKDFRLGDLIQGFINGQTHKCATEGCDRTVSEHALYLTHNTTRCSISLRKKAPRREPGVIWAWCKCNCCGEVSRPVKPSAYSLSMSTGKYFELLFYRPKALLPPRSEDLCEHLEQDDHSFTWCFSRDNTTVEIGLEPVSLYELRLPASEHPVSSTKSYRLDFDLEPTGDANDTEENVVRLSLQQEIVTFYAQLQFGIQAVKSKLPEDDFSRFEKVHAIQKVFKSHEISLCAALHSPPSISQARRTFKLRAASDANRLHTWVRKNRVQTDIPFVKDGSLPYSRDGIHLLPCQSAEVIVDEDLPASALAYSLSSLTFSKAFEEPLSEEEAPTLPESNKILSPSASTISSSFSRISTPLSSGAKFYTLGNRVLSGILPPASPRPEVEVKDTDDEQAWAIDDTVRAEASPKILKPHQSSLLGVKLRPHASDDSISLSASNSEPTLRSARSPSPAPDQSTDSDARVLANLLEDKHLPTKAKGVPNLIASLQQRGKHTVEPSTESKLSSVSNANVEIRFGSQKSALAGLSDTLKLQDLIDASYRLNTPEGPPPTSDRRAFDDSSRTASSASSLSSLWTGGDRSRKPPVPQNSPHLKLKTFDDGTKIAVTVWHAVEFANLRRRLGIDEDAFVRSLSTSEALDAKGGKTAAVFSVTSDRRFVLKQLVESNWIRGERESLLAMAPALIDYLGDQSGRPSLLCKIVAFFTVKYKKADGQTEKSTVVVMENVLETHVDRRFDLKGIHGRVAKTSENGQSSTLWDDEWLTSWARLLLILPHSKSVLQEAIQADSDWLAQNSLIDFSLLLGVDEGTKGITAGIIDYLCLFNFRKLLESKGKQAIKSKEAVTVLEPQAYAKRFRESLEEAFVSVPEKFSLDKKAISARLRLGTVI